MRRHAVFVLGFVKGTAFLKTKIVTITIRSSCVILENWGPPLENWGPPTNKAGVNGKFLGPVQTYHHNQLNCDEFVCGQPHPIMFLLVEIALNAFHVSMLRQLFTSTERGGLQVKMSRREMAA